MTVCHTRVNALADLLSTGRLVRIIEVHDPLSAMIAENVEASVGGSVQEYDGFWSSSLADSTVLGRPDTACVSIDKRLTGVQALFDVTTKPLIFDADNGGSPEDFALLVKAAQTIGISAVVIEDKTGPKRNSLLTGTNSQSSESIDRFTEKIATGRTNVNGPGFLVIARIESLILETGQHDAQTRAAAYVEAGANAIMIHSRREEPTEVFTFADTFRARFPDVPLVCVPTTYRRTRESELADHGFNVVIYANHLLRAAYPAMLRAATRILAYGRAEEAEGDLIPVADLLHLIPENER